MTMADPEKKSRICPRQVAVVALLLGTHAVLLGWGAARHSPTFDEAAYLPAGISHWTKGRFELYRANPHLVRMVAAAPVVMTEAETDWTRYNVRPGGMPEFAVGADFIRANGVQSFWYFTLARWACIPFSLLGAAVCYLWARDFYGHAAGLLAMTLWCFSPNVLAHGQLLTADIAATSLGIASFYLFYNWLCKPDWAGAFGVGVVLGLAQLTKANAILLFGFWPLLWGVSWLPVLRFGRDRHCFREGSQLLFILVIGLYLLNHGYAFEGSLKRLDEFQFVSRTLAGDAGDGNRFQDSWVGAVPVPLPENYLLGVDTLKRNLESNAKLNYLRGEFQEDGWWYYYLYGLLVKVPLGTWLLVLLAGTIGWRYGTNRFGETMLVVSFLSLLIFTSSQTGLNAHVRYVLPIAPFVFIWCSKLARSFAAANVRWKMPGRSMRSLGRWAQASAAVRHRGLAALTTAALAWSIASSLSVYPHSLSYFNELAGGPLRGHHHLLDSNIDWGQDLLYLKRWLEQHPEISTIGLANFGSYNPADIGIGFELPPMVPPLPRDANRPPEQLGPRPGWYAVSVNFLRGYRFYVHQGDGSTVWLREPSFTYFQHLEPVATAGYSIYIYHVGLDEANALRQQLGYPQLTSAINDSQ